MKRRTQKQIEERKKGLKKYKNPEKKFTKLKNLTYWSLFLIIAFTALGGVMNKIEAYEQSNCMDNTTRESSQKSYETNLEIRKEERANKQDNRFFNGKNEQNREESQRTSENGISPLCSLDAVICPKEKQGTIENLIAHYSDIYNFNLDTALRIADCESKTGKYLYNFSGSSAKGIYQFTNATWKDYCKGDVLNADDNIKCFMQLYNQHPTWWECV